MRRYYLHVLIPITLVVAVLAAYLTPLLGEPRGEAGWLARLHHGDPAYRVVAIDALKQHATEPVVLLALLEALHHDPDSEVRTAAADAVVLGGQRVAADLREALQDSCGQTRLTSVHSLGLLGVSDPVTVEALTVLAEGDPASRVRMQAMSVLGQAGPHARVALPVLRRALAEDDYALCYVAETAIRNIEQEPRRPD